MRRAALFLVPCVLASWIAFAAQGCGGDSGTVEFPDANGADGTSGNPDAPAGQDGSQPPPHDASFPPDAATPHDGATADTSSASDAPVGTDAPSSNDAPPPTDAPSSDAPSLTDANATDGSTSTDAPSPTDAASLDAPSAADGGADAGDPCTAVCDHVQACGVTTCGALGITCPDPRITQCLADCIDALSCPELTQGNVQACVAQCSDGGVADAPPPPDAPPPDAPITCATCGQGSCLTQLQACAQDSTCAGWLQCVQGCPQADGSCVAACDAQFPGAASLYDPVLACLCTSCSSECSGYDVCSLVPDGG